MAYIGRRPDEVFRAQAEHATFTGDGSTKTFDLGVDAPDNDADLAVYVDNVRQEPGSSKSYTIGADGSGNIRRITFVVAPAASAEIYVINPGRDTSLIDVSDAAVTTAKIASTAVTTAKIGADAITGAKLADDAVDSEHLTDGSVDNVHLSGSIANAKLANSSITINGTAVSLGGSVTAGTDWQAVTVADGSTTLTAAAGKGYFLDTNTGVIEVFFPTSPSRGDTILLVDYAGTFATNNAIINTGTQNVDSTTTRQYKLATNDTVAEFVYVDSAKGWITRILQAAGTTPTGVFTGGVYDTDPGFTAATGGTVTESGEFKIHTFTGDSNFVVTKVGSTCGGQGGPAVVDYVVVAGGGGGGADGSGGGGAGGFREAKSCSAGSYTASPLASSTGITLTGPGAIPVTVGGGGAGSTGCKGASGSNSVFSTITATGGGFGGAGSCTKGGDGGSGGGARTNSCRPNGGSGNTPPVSPAQGRDGGGNAPGNMKGGGGGGATAEGVDGPTGPMAGGAGATNHITGSPVVRAGGGGGGMNGTTQDGGPGGSGGGGNGGGNGPGPAVAGDAGTANTGGGGGGSGGGHPGRSGGAGGKGVVIIRYKFQ